MEVILAVAFDREVDLQRSKDDQLTQAAAHIFKFGRNNNPFLLVMQSEFQVNIYYCIYVHVEVYIYKHIHGK